MDRSRAEQILNPVHHIDEALQAIDHRLAEEAKLMSGLNQLVAENAISELEAEEAIRRFHEDS